MKQEVRQGSTETLKFTPAWINNRPAIATSATVVLKDSAGTTIQASAAVTAINATTGELTYTLTTTHTATLYENMVAEWTYVVSSATYVDVTLWDCVKHKLSQLLIDEDLYTLQGDIREKSQSVFGAVVSATASTLVDAKNLSVFTDDTFNNGTVEAIDASGVVQRRTVTDFVQSTGSLSITPNWASTPDTTYRYVVYKPQKAKMDIAFEILLNDIRAKGFRPALIMNSADLKFIHAFKTLHLICMDFMKADGDLWSVLSDKYAELYKDSFGKLIFQYDTDESGAIGEAEKNQTLSRLYMVR